MTFSGHPVNSIILISGSSTTIYSLKDQNTFQRNCLKYEIELQLFFHPLCWGLNGVPQVAQTVKASACNVGDLGLIPG